jgi:hypothetical protein
VRMCALLVRAPTSFYDIDIANKSQCESIEMAIAKFSIDSFRRSVPY